MFTFLVFLSAFLLESIGTYVSVVGLGALFAYSGVVMTMAVALDIAKVTAVTFLYRHWKEVGWTMKSYLLSATLVLMLITSSGVFGFLSGEFQKAIAGNSQQTIVIKSLEDEQGRLQKRKEEIDKQIAQLPQNAVRGRRQLMQQFGPEVNRLNERLAEIDKKLPELKIANIEKETHVGPIMYVAEAFNTTPVEAVKWLNLIIIGVFDPLAIALLVAGNFLLSRNKKDTFVEKAVEEFSAGPAPPTLTEMMDKEDTRKRVEPIPLPDDKWMNNILWTDDAKSESNTGEMLKIGPDPLVQRLEKALASPSYEMPQGLTREERRQRILDAAAGKIEPVKKKRKYVRKEKNVAPEREKVVIKAPPKKPRAVKVEQKDDREVIKLEPVATNLENVDGRRGDVVVDTGSSNSSDHYKN